MQCLTFIMLQQRMEPVRRTFSEDTTTRWKEIALIGKPGKEVMVKAGKPMRHQGDGTARISKVAAIARSSAGVGYGRGRRGGLC